MRKTRIQQEKDIRRIDTDLRNISKVLCSLNRKASILGSSVALVSSTLTNRLMDSYLIETKDTGIEKMIDDNFNPLRYGHTRFRW